MSDNAFVEKVKFIFSDLAEFFWPLLKLFLTAAGRATIQIAAVSVLAAEEAMGSGRGSDKFDMAKEAVLATLAEKGVEIGIEVTIGMIHTAIEAAHSKLNKAAIE